jgi:hypothetical protein
MEEHQQVRRIKNLTLAGIAALTGCVAVIVILSALLLGLWLDSVMGQRGPAVVILLVLSAPVSLFLMTTIALKIVNRIQPQLPKSKDEDNEEEVIS